MGDMSLGEDEVDTLVEVVCWETMRGETGTFGEEGDLRMSIFFELILCFSFSFIYIHIIYSNHNFLPPPSNQVPF
jgi:hypothetical protein